MSQERIVHRDRQMAPVAHARMRYVVLGGLALAALAFVLMFLPP